MVLGAYTHPMYVGPMLFSAYLSYLWTRVDCLEFESSIITQPMNLYYGRDTHTQSNRLAIFGGL